MCGLGVKVWGCLGFRVWGSGVRGFSVQGPGFKVDPKT